MNFFVLPYEMLMEIFKFLDPIDEYFEGNLNLVTTDCNKVTKMDCMWEIWVESIYPNTTLKKEPSNSYKSFFIEIYNCRRYNGKEVVLEAVRNYGNALRWSSDKLKDDKEIVMEAVRNCEGTLRWASDKLKDDKEDKEVEKESYEYLLWSDSDSDSEK